MKRNIKLVLIIVISLFFVNLGQVDASSGDYLDRARYSKNQINSALTVKGLFQLYYNIIGEGISPGYKYIKLNYKNVEKGTNLYDALQKGVYLDLIKNKDVTINLDANATEDIFNKMLNVNFNETFKAIPKKILTLGKFLDIMQELKDISQTEDKVSSDSSVYPIENVSNFPILNDVYLKLKANHYDSESFKDEDLMNGAIKGMAEATGDKYTTYFPPIDSKDFQDQLSGSFEGIGAQVDMEKPGILTIIAPLPGSPAEAAGLKGGDRVIKIDGVEITEKTTLQNAIAKIKGVKGTTVTLTVIRNSITMDIKIVRDKIILNYVNYKKLDNGDNYIQITLFGVGTLKAFSGVVDRISKENPNGKTIIDLRNNPGGSLDEVAGILNYFVPKGLSAVNIKYKNFSTDIISVGSNFSFLDKKVVVMINSGSASASEIMAATIKDYMPNMKIIGEKSYGKGSVQNLDGYADGSSFKYTIAKWFSGKTKTGIDGVGISPDEILKLDEAQFKSGTDNQLNYAKNLSF
ncbi:MAG: S41 family peptidase [Candidatus Gracilibacteria bacterium]|nr:S41 family peptidase [Candidatus Gracilibacteria bacterium]